MAQKINFAERARAAAGITEASAPSSLIREIEGKEHYNFQLIPYDKILPSSDNLYPMEAVEEIKESIQTYGLLHNLVLKPLDEPSGCYRILSGEQRYRAIGLLLADGDPKFKNGVPARILDRNTSEVDEKIILEEANLKQRNNPQAIREGIQRLNDLYQHKNEAEGNNASIVKQVAASTGISERQVQKYNAINERLIPELREAFDAKGLTIAQAAELAALPELTQKFLASALSQEDKVKTAELAALKQQATAAAGKLESLRTQLATKEEEQAALKKARHLEQGQLTRLMAELDTLRKTPAAEQQENAGHIAQLEAAIRTAEDSRRLSEDALKEKERELENARQELENARQARLPEQEKKRLGDLYKIEALEADLSKRQEQLRKLKEQYQHNYGSAASLDKKFVLVNQ